MPLPDEISAAQTKENCARLWEQPGGQTFRNGSQFDLPASYPSGPTGLQPARPAVDDAAELTTHVDPEDEK